MKRCLPLTTLATLAAATGLNASEVLVDDEYPGLFSPAASVTVDPVTSPGLLDVQIDSTTEASGPLGSRWEATATGGAELYLLTIPILSTGAQVAISNNSLNFNISEDAGDLLEVLGVELSVGLAWEATVTFDAPGQVVELVPDTVYRVYFNVTDGTGLLSSTLGINPTFGVELLDGAGNPIGYSGGGNIADILGLDLVDNVGGPTGTQRAMAEFRTGATVPAGAAGIRFTGSADLPATVLDLGTNFANVSQLELVAVDPYTLWIEDSDVEDPSDWDPNADPDQDGRINLQEYALSTDPASGAHGDAYVAVGDGDGPGGESSNLVMTIAVLEGAEFDEGTGGNAGDLVATTTSVDYRVEGSFDLEIWNLAVEEVVANEAFRAGLPELPSGWAYRSFRVPGETADTEKAFLRVVFE